MRRLPQIFVTAIATAAVVGCATTTVTTTALPPHRLENPICPLAVIVPTARERCHREGGSWPASG
jgi:hypothetical protein